MYVCTVARNIYIIYINLTIGANAMKDTEGKKTILVALPFSVYQAFSDLAYHRKIKIATYTRELIINEIVRFMKENQKE